MLLFSVATALTLFHSVQASVTVYGQVPLAHTSAAANPQATQLPAYNTTVLNPPPVPQSFPNTFTLNLQNNGGNQNLSIPQRGDFFGFSIEMSVLGQVLGKNSTHLQVPFLNLMGNLKQRAGKVRIRMGGNTQEFAYMVNELDNWRAQGKEGVNNQNPTQTPSVTFTVDLFYMASNISALVNVQWFLGIPFNDTSNWRLAIAEYGQQILGNNLIGLQAGNEPDLYVAHKHRPETYGPRDYFNEVGDLVQQLAKNPKTPRSNLLIGPSLANSDWTLEQVWETGYADVYRDNLAYLSCERYPTNNCFAQFGLGTYVDPQTVFPTFLDHTASQKLVETYLPSTALAVSINKPFIMFETNTASCGGFFGVSDSFGATLWMLDYGLQMAYSNFSGALIHVGGQNVFYNPFTAPPTNTTSFNQWTIGAVYYSVLAMTEVLGNTDKARVVDLLQNEGNIYTPQYGVYEDDVLTRVALFNFVTDTTHASDLKVTLTVQGGQVPASVKVKYLLSDSVATKNNITWAGQTFGQKFEVDGRLKGTFNVVTVPCNVAANTCLVNVPSPGFALVFLKDAPALTMDESSQTYATSAHTQHHNTATVDPKVLETSNGGSAKDRQKLASTSKGGLVNGAGEASWQRAGSGIGIGLVAALVMGALAVWGR